MASSQIIGNNLAPTSHYQTEMSLNRQPSPQRNQRQDQSIELNQIQQQRQATFNTKSQQQQQQNQGNSSINNNQISKGQAKDNNSVPINPSENGGSINLSINGGGSIHQDVTQLSSKDAHNSDIRRDRFGNIIKYGSKSHKIVFRDQIEKTGQIKDVYEVESWKKYNAMADGDDESFKCKCLIF
eukprot:403367972